MLSSPQDSPGVCISTQTPLHRSPLFSVVGVRVPLFSLGIASHPLWLSQTLASILCIYFFIDLLFSLLLRADSQTEKLLLLLLIPRAA